MNYTPHTTLSPSFSHMHSSQITGTFQAHSHRAPPSPSRQTQPILSFTLVWAPSTIRRAPKIHPQWVSFSSWVYFLVRQPHLTFDPPSIWVRRPHLTSDLPSTKVDPHPLKPINNPSSDPPSRIRSIYIYIYLFIYLFNYIIIYLFIYLLF